MPSSTSHNSATSRFATHICNGATELQKQQAKKGNNLCILDLSSCVSITSTTGTTNFLPLDKPVNIKIPRIDVYTTTPDITPICEKVFDEIITPFSRLVIRKPILDGSLMSIDTDGSFGFIQKLVYKLKKFGIPVAIVLPGSNVLYTMKNIELAMYHRYTLPSIASPNELYAQAILRNILGAFNIAFINHWGLTRVPIRAINLSKKDEEPTREFVTILEAHYWQTQVNDDNSITVSPDNTEACLQYYLYRAIGRKRLNNANYSSGTYTCIKVIRDKYDFVLSYVFRDQNGVIFIIDDKKRLRAFMRKGRVEFPNLRVTNNDCIVIAPDANL